MFVWFFLGPRNQCGPRPISRAGQIGYRPKGPRLIICPIKPQETTFEVTFLTLLLKYTISHSENPSLISLSAAEIVVHVFHIQTKVSRFQHVSTVHFYLFPFQNNVFILTHGLRVLIWQFLPSWNDYFVWWGNLDAINWMVLSCSRRWI